MLVEISWDVNLKDKNNKTTADVGNYTYNVSPMYEKAMGMTLSDFNNMATKQAIQILEKGISEMIENKHLYIELNPDNGWGNYEGALKFLQDILKACKKHCKSYIDVS